MSISQQIGAASMVKWGVCTSTTRPATPYTGQHIYESDTNLEYVWNGSAWVQNYISAASPALTGTPTAPTATAGTNTTQLATTAFVTTAAANVTSGFRNAIINGGFDIWQRGTNYTTAGGGYGSADRWYSGFATGSFTQQPFTVGGTTITGYEPKYFGRWTISSNSQNYELLQKIEGVRSFAGQQITISFWARQTSGTVSVNGRWVQHFGTGGSPSSTVVTNFIAPLTVTGSWVRYQYTMTVPSLSGKTVGTANDDSCWLSFQVVNTATGSLDFWGVQVESGSQATPFEQRPIGVELALCQRYYYRRSQLGGYNFIEGMGLGVNFSNGFFCSFQNPVEMRSAPVYSLVSGTTGVDAYGVASSATYSSQQTTTKGGRISYTTSGLTDYRPYFLIGNADSTVQFNSEL